MTTTPRGKGQEPFSAGLCVLLEHLLPRLSPPRRARMWAERPLPVFRRPHRLRKRCLPRSPFASARARSQPTASAASRPQFPPGQGRLGSRCREGLSSLARHGALLQRLIPYLPAAFCNIKTSVSKTLLHNYNREMTNQETEHHLKLVRYSDSTEKPFSLKILNLRGSVPDGPDASSCRSKFVSRQLRDPSWKTTSAKCSTSFSCTFSSPASAAASPLAELVAVFFAIGVASVASSYSLSRPPSSSFSSSALTPVPTAPDSASASSLRRSSCRNRRRSIVLMLTTLHLQ